MFSHVDASRHIGRSSVRHRPAYHRGALYAVLVAEQLWAAGAKVNVGLTSAGRVSPILPLPSIAVVEKAIRDEGT